MPEINQTEELSEIPLQNNPPEKPVTELQFSNKYDDAHAKQYLDKHQDGFYRKLSNRRDISLAKRALKIAGNPQTVLDLPCGAGRFWPLLAEKKDRKIFAADNSRSMIQIAMNSQPPEITQRINAFQTSVFSIDLSDESVDSIFCMRLIHHIADKQHRLEILQEFHRVCRDTVILSLWVDGNFKSWKRKRLEQRRAKRKGKQCNKNRFVLERHLVESEFKASGFTVEGKLDFLPAYAMWRVYILKKIPSK